MTRRDFIKEFSLEIQKLLTHDHNLLPKFRKAQSEPARARRSLARRRGARRTDRQVQSIRAVTNAAAAARKVTILLLMWKLAGAAARGKLLSAQATSI
eukprot:5767415-Pleurochrysis_carterae.AAC.1